MLNIEKRNKIQRGEQMKTTENTLQERLRDSLSRALQDISRETEAQLNRSFPMNFDDPHIPHYSPKLEAAIERYELLKDLGKGALDLDNFDGRFQSIMNNFHKAYS